jgi:DNA-binding CsgD family transcriptional regulator
MNQYDIHKNPYDLTDGELAVLRLVIQGHDNLEMSEIRGVTKATVASQKTRGLRKVGVTTIKALRPIIEAIPEGQIYCKLCRAAIEEME